MAKQEMNAAEAYRAKRKARIAKAAKKNSKKMLSPEAGKTIGRVLSVVLVAALVIGIAWFALDFSGVLQRTLFTAFTMEDGTKVSAAEYNFYYMTTLNNIEQSASYYGLSYDTSKTPDNQDYDGSLGAIEGFPEDKTPTWNDYLSYSAKEAIRTIKGAVSAAAAQNVTLNDEEKAEIETEIASVKTAAENNNHSVNAYLRKVYGKGINEKLYREILEEQHLNTKLSEAKEDEIKATLTDEQVMEKYNEEITTYGAISYRSYEVKPKTELDENETELPATEEAIAAAKANAKALAAVTSEEEFKTKASEIAKETGATDYKTYLTDDSMTLHSDVKGSDLNDTEFKDWAFGKKAKVGKTYSTEGTDSTIVYFLTETVHQPKGDLTYDVRHILISLGGGAEGNENTEVPALNLDNAADVRIITDIDTKELTDKAAYLKAQSILQEYLDGEHTAEAFGELAKKYTEDSNADKGGLYDNVPLGQMVPQFENWCTAKGRTEGDVGIVETSYGYHVMYFVGSKTADWDEAIKEALAHAEVDTYMESLQETEAATIAKESNWVLKSTQKSIMKIVRTNIRNSASTVSY